MGKDDLGLPLYKLHSNHVCRGTGGRRCVHKITCVVENKFCAAYSNADRYMKADLVTMWFWKHTEKELQEARAAENALITELAHAKADGFTPSDHCKACGFTCKLGTGKTTCEAIKIVQTIPCGLVK
jgi:hypothetical protein